MQVFLIERATERATPPGLQCIIKAPGLEDRGLTRGKASGLWFDQRWKADLMESTASSFSQANSCTSFSIGFSS